LHRIAWWFAGCTAPQRIVGEPAYKQPTCGMPQQALYFLCTTGGGHRAKTTCFEVQSYHLKPKYAKFFVVPSTQVIAVITPTPRTFSDIFAPRAPLLLVKEYEDKPYQEPTTTTATAAGKTRTATATATAGTSAATADSATKTATALATLKAIISQVQNKVGSIVLFLPLYFVANGNFKKITKVLLQEAAVCLFLHIVSF
jgi:hypothetical protein